MHSCDKWSNINKSCDSSVESKSVCLKVPQPCSSASNSELCASKLDEVVCPSHSRNKPLEPGESRHERDIILGIAQNPHPDDNSATNGRSRFNITSRLKRRRGIRSTEARLRRWSKDSTSAHIAQPQPLSIPDPDPANSQPIMVTPPTWKLIPIDVSETEHLKRKVREDAVNPMANIMSWLSSAEPTNGFHNEFDPIGIADPSSKRRGTEPNLSSVTEPTSGEKTTVATMMIQQASPGQGLEGMGFEHSIYEPETPSPLPTDTEPTQIPLEPTLSKPTSPHIDPAHPQREPIAQTQTSDATVESGKAASRPMNDQSCVIEQMNPVAPSSSNGLHGYIATVNQQRQSESQQQLKAKLQSEIGKTSRARPTVKELNIRTNHAEASTADLEEGEVMEGGCPATQGAERQTPKVKRKNHRGGTSHHRKHKGKPMKRHR